MALKLTTAYRGVSIQDAYWRVSSVTSDKTQMEFNVGFHVDSNSPEIFGETYSCAYDLNGYNPIKQAYEYLKTLPEFSSAVDVLED